MTATLAPARPSAAAGRATFAALAIRETRRLVLNPVFLFAVAFITFALWAGPDAGQTEIDTSNPYPAIFLGGFGMMATYWLTRSMRASEPVVGVTPVTQSARTAALCAVALVPLAGNVLLGFAAACVLRTRTGEPGAVAGTAVVVVLMAPSLVPQVARWVRTFPASGAGGPSSDLVWWTVLAVCVVAIAVSVGGRSLPPWMSAVPISRRRRSYPTVQSP